MKESDIILPMTSFTKLVKESKFENRQEQLAGKESKVRLTSYTTSTYM